MAAKKTTVKSKTKKAPLTAAQKIKQGLADANNTAISKVPTYHVIDADEAVLENLAAGVKRVSPLVSYTDDSVQSLKQESEEQMEALTSWVARVGAETNVTAMEVKALNEKYTALENKLRLTSTRLLLTTIVALMALVLTFGLAAKL